MATKTPEAKAVPAVAVTFHDAKGIACSIMERPEIMQVAFGDGSNLHVDRNDLSQVVDACFWHGAKQKLIDAAAISRNPETGKPATIGDKAAAVQEVFERLVSGEWNKRREGGETGGLLLRALLRMYDGRKSRDDLIAYLGGKTDEEKVALRANPKVAAIIAEIKAEKADDSIDTDALLGELDE